ncbi:unnamed protein product [Miscanthus lutarioriparius]|uniref:Uncharacterized protein n=1 Tax=Miscanthus lutarioriparius TaxID=422564 RepID=A0A811RW95_9POAL|nr:unnamed protein product [Miscanthus lutarioriparius]
MAAEAAEPPSPPPPRTGEADAETPATPGKRAPADRDEKEQEGAERPEPKRRRARARIAALDSVPRASETTPKFGSFNPGATTTVAAAAELVAFHLMKASRCRVDSSATEEAGDHRTVAGGGEEAAAEGSDENSR